MNSFLILFRKPFLILLILLVFWTVFLIFGEPSSSNILYLSIFSGFLLFTSFLVIAFQKKWIKILYTFILYSISFILIISFFILSSVFDKDNYSLGDKDFYLTEVKGTTGLILNNLKIINKIDTIRYIGMEGEYDAECLFIGERGQIIEFENQIKRNIKFDKIKNVNIKSGFDTRLNIRDLRDYKFLSWYEYEDDGRFEVQIAFGDNTIYYKAIHY